MGVGSISSMTDLFGAAAIEIRMNGQPIGKGRPRFSRKSGTVYTPEKTARYEERLAWAAQSVMAGRPLLAGGVCLTVMAFMDVPASWSRKKRADALAQRIYPLGKPDFDNIAKMVDALKRIVWTDDTQVVDAHIFKRYSDRPRLEINVAELAPGLRA